MVFTLIVRSKLATSHSALQFAEAIIHEQHKINGVYFLLDGAYLANLYIDLPTDEPNLNLRWREIAQINDFPLIVCAANGLRRGITTHNLINTFKIGSIGQLVESCEHADRVVTL